MHVKQFNVGGDRNFAYFVGDEESKKCVLIDPSYKPESLLQYISKNDYKLIYSFSTHGHSDHTNGNEYVTKNAGVPTLLYGGTNPIGDLKIHDRVQLPLGALSILILHTPGHTSDSMCLYIGNALFTGDTLFVGKVGGTDFESGARAEYSSLHEKILKLPGNTIVYPGHDYGVAPFSTIEKEIKTNPFLLQPDFESFVDLKKNWQSYKRLHGID